MVHYCSAFYNREYLVVPPGTRIQEYTGIDETETHSTGARITALCAGAVANRQLAIYDKRAEAIIKRKTGWGTIWNASLEKSGKPPLEMMDRNQSQVWRFELRMGSKQLRDKWEMRSWANLDATIVDAFNVFFCERTRYCTPFADSNRARWPIHDLWRVVLDVVEGDLSNVRSSVIPEEVKTANREEHKRMLGAQILGLLVSRAAVECIGDGLQEFEKFIIQYERSIRKLSRSHHMPIGERITKANQRYKFI